METPAPVADLNEFQWNPREVVQIGLVAGDAMNNEEHQCSSEPENWIGGESKLYGGSASAWAEKWKAFSGI